MIRPLIPLSYREEQVITLLFAGYPVKEIARMLGLGVGAVRGALNRASAKIGGPAWATAEIRCLIWKAMEVGVMQYLAGLRTDDGRFLAPPALTPAVTLSLAGRPMPE